MSLDRAFRLSSIVLAAAAFTGLLLTGEIPAGLAGLGLLALLISLGQVGGYGKAWAIFRLSHGAWNLLMIAAFVAFAVDLLWISQDLLPAGIHFLILLMVNKLLNLQQRKDFLHLYAISLSELLATAALTVELWYGVVFITYLLAAIWTLLLYHLKSEAEEAEAAHSLTANPRGSKAPRDATQAPSLITSRLFWTTNAVAVGAFCLTLTIFFVTPRIGAGFFQKNRVERVQTSGFSETVDLGVIGAVKLDQTIVMRVEFPNRRGPIGERLYFRGAAYDAYDGRSWSNTLSRRRRLVRGTDEVFKVHDESPGEASTALRQDILIEALDTSVLFGLSFLDSVKGNFLALQADGMGGVYLPYPPVTRIQYSAYSLPDHLRKEDRAAFSFTYPESIRQHFLPLPDLSSGVAGLAREVTRQARTPYDKVVALERHLREQYRYSLDVGPAGSSSPIEEFLFSRKTGYCEHYATAMVVLLRTLGIPARLATGFLPGEWNDFGNYYTVRQRDAHAWVEVFFPRSGWVTFDPTPTVVVPPSSPFLTGIGRVVDSIRLQWDRFVIQYSFRDQMAVAQGVREQSDRVRRQISGAWADVLRRWATLREQVSGIAQASGALFTGLLIILLGLAGVIAGLVVRSRRGGGQRQAEHQTTHQMAAVRLYHRMLRLLEARGLGKAPGAAPLEFARLVARESGEAGRFVQPLTDLYCRVRFGQTRVSPEELREAEELLHGLDAVKGSSESTLRIGKSYA